MRIRLEHSIELSADQFFDRIYFNEDFNRRLYQELGFQERVILEHVDQGDTVFRRVRQVPLRDLPAPLKKLLRGASLGYEEETRYDKLQQRADIVVIPVIKPDKVKIFGACWIEPAGPGRCTRLVELDVKVSVFGVGSMVERMLVADINKDHEKSADITNCYIREHLQDTQLGQSQVPSD